MKSRTRRTILALTTTALLGVAGAGALATAADAGSTPSASVPSANVVRTLTGTWRAQVTRQDCATGAAGPTFPALLTFDRQGTMIETTAAFPPSQRTPGHGVWSQTGRRQFTAVSEAFLFNPAAAFTGMQRITQSIAMGGDPKQATSTATFEIFDPAGQLVTTGCANAVLTKME